MLVWSRRAARVERFDVVAVGRTDGFTVAGHPGCGGVGGLVAPREDAGHVAQREVFADPVGDLVAVHTDRVVQIDHRLHDDLDGGLPPPAAAPIC